MSPRSPLHHGTFSIERSFRAAPDRSFAAWSDPELKANWFAGPPESWTLIERKLDFRVGGTEILHGRFLAGSSLFVAHYFVIEPEQLIVYAYDMHVSSKHLSTSLASVEFARTSQGGTRMKYTEQAAFLEGGAEDLRSREIGTLALLDRMGTLLGAA
ncbi:MAG: SRPBCC domain-containing protein [Myxococcales bacterium]